MFGCIIAKIVVVHILMSLRVYKVEKGFNLFKKRNKDITILFKFSAGKSLFGKMNENNRF